MIGWLILASKTCNLTPVTGNQLSLFSVAIVFLAMGTALQPQRIPLDFLQALPLGPNIQLHRCNIFHQPHRGAHFRILRGNARATNASGVRFLTTEVTENTEVSERPHPRFLFSFLYKKQNGSSNLCVLCALCG